MFMMVLGSQCSGTSFAQSRALELISATLADPTRHVQPAELFDIIDPLPPLSPEELLGEWSATGFNTGHPLYHWLKSINCVGTKFWSEGDVEPLVVATQTRDGCGTRKRWLTEWGNGQVGLPSSPLHIEKGAQDGNVLTRKDRFWKSSTGASCQRRSSLTITLSSRISAKFLVPPSLVLLSASIIRILDRSSSSLYDNAPLVLSCRRLVEHGISMFEAPRLTCSELFCWNKIFALSI
ncbi:hypothetical protein MPH_01326 [Macrophomina phaseolina MS6]|uniref:GXWXG domain-containing protein n=1 Tax=Macrophomina phaseolina (strain MS6) TaxID=1126212 RepID=K2SFW5_MACPH|nr:hypothetical protein MPH_01326 [Macrophomina phaseolina MS6]